MNQLLIDWWTKTSLVDMVWHSALSYENSQQMQLYLCVILTINYKCNFVFNYDIQIIIYTLRDVMLSRF